MKKIFALLALSTYLAGCQSNLTPSVQRLPSNLRVQSRGVTYTAYYGLNHSHTASDGDDGREDTDAAFQYAREKGKLDFFACTPHSHMLTPDGYKNLLASAQKYNEDGKFVTLVGQEWGSLSKGGHVNVFGANELCQVTSGDWNTFYQTWVPAHPEISWMSMNHPRKDHFNTSVIKAKSPAYTKYSTIATLGSLGEYENEDGKAPISTKAETYDFFLNQGFKVGAIGEQDNHRANWGTSSPVRTGVWAKKLSNAEITKAIQERRTFSTQVPNLKLWFTLNNQDMGSEGTSTRAMKFTITLQDPTKETTQLYLYGDTDGVGGEQAMTVGQSMVQNGQASWTFDYKAPQGGSMYFYVRAISNDGIMAFSSPIWVNVAE